MSSDIEKPFHQIRLQEQDRDYTRVVWLKDITEGPINGNFVTYRFTRIPFGMTCSPFLLAASILTYMEKYPAKINKKMESNINVLVLEGGSPEVGNELEAVPIQLTESTTVHPRRGSSTRQAKQNARHDIRCNTRHNDNWDSKAARRKTNQKNVTVILSENL
uniref:Uncharacterized protein n=1 Tax=Caenorhabditis japonica TaxID=281687 RepID=A0A8R1ESY5_CAEJA